MLQKRNKSEKKKKKKGKEKNEKGWKRWRRLKVYYESLKKSFSRKKTEKENAKGIEF